MKKKLFFTFMLVTGLICTGKSQIINRTRNDNMKKIQYDSLGFFFKKIGPVLQVGKSTYKIMLSSDNSSVESAAAQVSVSGRLFLDLPGSYGGIVNPDSSSTGFYKNRIMVDSFKTNNESFTREYWAVYAGMGMWDCVINCYKKEGNKYYILSLIQDKQIGKPGEVSGGKSLTSEELKLKIVFSLKDTTEAIIKQFNELVSSFQTSN